MLWRIPYVAWWFCCRRDVGYPDKYFPFWKPQPRDRNEALFTCYLSCQNVLAKMASFDACLFILSSSMWNLFISQVSRVHKAIWKSWSIQVCFRPKNFFLFSLVVRGEGMFYESNEPISHESMSQQVGSAVFCTVSAKCRLQAADRVENGNWV